MLKYKTMNQRKLQKDLKFGFRSEDTARKHLNKYFKCELFNTRSDDNDKYNKFDYRGTLEDDTKIKVELKTRRCKFGDYPDLQFELGKIKETQKFIKENPTAKCYFVWRCINEGWGENAFYVWEYNPEEYFEGEGGRRDRGIDEWKILCKVENKYISKMFP